MANIQMTTIACINLKHPGLGDFSCVDLDQFFRLFMGHFRECGGATCVTQKILNHYNQDQNTINQYKNDLTERTRELEQCANDLFSQKAVSLEYMNNLTEYSLKYKGDLTERTQELGQCANDLSNQKAVSLECMNNLTEYQAKFIASENQPKNLKQAINKPIACPQSPIIEITISQNLQDVMPAVLAKCAIFSSATNALTWIGPLKNIDAILKKGQEVPEARYCSASQFPSSMKMSEYFLGVYLCCNGDLTAENKLGANGINAPVVDNSSATYVEWDAVCKEIICHIKNTDPFLRFQDINKYWNSTDCSDTPPITEVF